MKKRLIFSLIVFLLTFFLINKVSKFFLENSINEKNKETNLEKIHGKDKAADYKIVAIEQSRLYSYKPFVEFMEQPRTGKFTSVSVLGNRCNNNFIKICNRPNGGKNEVWFFGGSTAFGYGVKNNETISSYIEKLNKNKLKVINFGTTHFNSTQARILFQNLLTEFDPPYAAVFLNGNNDYLKTYTYNESSMSNYIRYKVQKTSKDDLKDYFKERITRLNFIRLINQKFFKKKEILKEKNEDNISKNSSILKKNQEMNLIVGKHFDIVVLNILQPAPIFERSYESSKIPEEFKLKKNSTRYNNLKKGYEYFINTSKHEYLDLSKFIIDEPMFIDMFHYSSEFNNALAYEVIKKLGL